MNTPTFGTPGPDPRRPARISEANGSSLRDLTQDVDALRRAAMDDGRPDAVTAQRKYGKFTARERIDLLVDDGSFTEFGALAQPANLAHGIGNPDGPGDGVIIGRGRIEGRPVSLVSYDFTVFGASMGSVNDQKFARARQFSLQNSVPLVMLVEGGGARIHERMGSTTIRGHERFSDLSLLSGWVPIVSCVLGACYAGHANLVALSDYSVMVEGSSLGMAGPRLAEMATGEKVSKEELGGPSLHAKEIGSIDAVAATEEEAISRIVEYLALFPSNSGQPAPRKPFSEPVGRLPDELLDLVPESPNRAYDMRKVVDLILDEGSRFELRDQYARNLITTLGRVGGHVIGIIANNPMFLAGCLDSKASDKMAHFINLCDAYSIPLLFLSDVPGYLVGSAAEKTNIVRRSMRPLWELGQSTTPILTIIIRKAYGLAYHTMGGAEFHPALLVAWPSAQVSPMGARGAVNVVLGKDDSEVDTEEFERLVGEFRALENPMVAARAFKVDDVIDPRDTRSKVFETLQLISEMGHNSAHWRPPKKRGISPL